MSSAAPAERGRVSLRADPDGDRTIVALYDDTVLTFGRGADCAIRFGHAPIRDREVPRRAGWLIVANGRVMVEAPGPDDSDGHTLSRPLQVVTERGGTRPLDPGETWGPPSEIFTLVVTGEQSWELDVINFRDLAKDCGSDGDLPTIKQRVELAPDLWEVLVAYSEPMLHGDRFPATHEQVAKTINWNKMTARRRLERIHDEFYLRRVQMPDVADMRVKVVESAITHGLLPRSPDG